MLNITGRQSNQPNSATGGGGTPGGTGGGTTGPPESDSGGTEGGNQIQSHSLLTPVGSADYVKIKQSRKMKDSTWRQRLVVLAVQLYC